MREVSGAHQDRGAGDVKAYGTVRSPVHRPAMYSTVRRKGFMDILRLIFSILLPPLGVFLQVGFGGQFLLNILLTLLGYVPGLIHSVWIIATRR